MPSVCLRRVSVVIWSSQCSAVWLAVCGTPRVVLSLLQVGMVASVGTFSASLTPPHRLLPRGCHRLSPARPSSRHRRCLLLLAVVLAWRRLFCLMLMLLLVCLLCGLLVLLLLLLLVVSHW